ncbi:hypothetical protein SAMN05518683_1056 [Salibacterium halotolerans]|uniref:Uncharacterized protein n=1 Tax=Salibacterium halotolerans TaxID=1884432 RepID=A0A1I5Q2I0_9BACI|nr:hypothetical protein SAMN05518683_1056 [Salibacterium halotolerans]
MDLTIFMTGTACFGAGFFLLLFFLLRKKQLFIPFLLMGAGVVLCFAGLVLSSPLTNSDHATSLYDSTINQARPASEPPPQPLSEK